MTSSDPGLWNDYFDTNTATWRDNAASRWLDNASQDPNTGIWNGPTPLPPWSIARNVQAAHDRAIWQYRQRLMQQGIGRLRAGTQFAQGALGLLQSFRPGGSAALEANIYGQVGQMTQNEAGGYFQQAQQTQPLDYLGDLRRHESALAQQRANRANERYFIANIVTALASQSSTGSGDSGGGLSNGLKVDSGGSTSSSSGNGSSSSGGGSSLSAGLEADPQQGQQQTLSAQMDPAAAPPIQTAPGPQPNQGQGQQGMGGVSGQAETNQGSQFGGPTMGGQAQGPLVGGGAGGQPGQMGAGAGVGVGAGAGMAAMPMAAGQSGDFSRTAYAAQAAGSPIAGMADLPRISLSNFLSDLYENDPFWQTLPYALERRWAQRMGAA